MVTPERSTFIKIMPRDKIIANIDRDSHQIIADYVLQFCTLFICMEVKVIVGGQNE